MIDPALSTNPALLVIIFKRMDNGDMVKAVLDKSKLGCLTTTGKNAPLKKKVMEGTANNAHKFHVFRACKNMKVGVMIHIKTSVCICRKFH